MSNLISKSLEITDAMDRENDSSFLNDESTRTIDPKKWELLMSKSILVYVIQGLILTLVFMLTLSLASWSQHTTWIGKVVGVSDGDTINVMHDGKTEKIRLYGIDCPEKRPAFGKRAKKFSPEGQLYQGG